jgi:hypothetical protein
MSKKTLKLIELIKEHIPTFDVNINNKEYRIDIKIKGKEVFSGPTSVQTDNHLILFLSGVLVGCNK